MRNKNGIGIFIGFIITISILLVMVFITTVLGGSLLKFLGMEYDSFWSVFLFFVIYFIVDFPIDMFVDAFPRAMRQMGRIKSRAAEWALYIALSIPIDCAIMMGIDYFVDSVTMPLRAILIFVTVLCILNLVLAAKGEKGSGTVRVYLRERKPERKEDSRMLLQEVLYSYCEDKGLPSSPEKLQIATGPHGKPFAARQAAGRGKDGKVGELVPRDDIFFSVSHTRHWWMCAVYGKPIGADIEEWDREISLELAARFFHDKEQEYLEKQGRTKNQLLELWVRKEAYVKYLGTGLNEGLSSFSVVEDGKLAEEIGNEDRKAFGGSVFAQGMKDEEGYPLPLIGAFFTSKPPESIDIGFLGLEGDEAFEQ